MVRDMEREDRERDEEKVGRIWLPTDEMMDTIFYKYDFKP